MSQQWLSISSRNTPDWDISVHLGQKVLITVGVYWIGIVFTIARVTSLVYWKSN
jgi:hypothetical protein